MAENVDRYEFCIQNHVFLHSKSCFFAFKIMFFAFKNMNFGQGWRGTDWLGKVSKNAEFCIKNEEFCMQNDGICRGTPDALGRTLWTGAEDVELAVLVEKHGVGSWDQIEGDFSTNRTADALRKRWVKLQAPAKSRAKLMSFAFKTMKFAFITMNCALN